jgi:RecA-family ATPase
MLFGEFWLEGELSILFADTGKGKSILAVQIAESITRGTPIGPLRMTANPQKVLYFDFELTEKQFEMRYAADPRDGEELLSRHYRFSDKFYTAEIALDGDFPADFASFEQYLRASVEKGIRGVGAKVVIIDNITYLRGPNDTAREAIPLMRELRRLKKELGLSILVLAHTPKRDTARRITVNDLQGSKVLSNFADNIFAIGQSGIDAGCYMTLRMSRRSRS